MKRIYRLLDAAYSETGHELIPPEYLLCAQWLQVLYTTYSEHQQVVYIGFNLLFRWFIGLSIDIEVWDHTSLSKKRDRLLQYDIFLPCLQKWLRWRAIRTCSVRSISASIAP